MTQRDTDTSERLLLGAAVAVGAALLVAVRELARRERRFDRTVEGRRDALRAQAPRQEDSRETISPDEGLPAPVRRYLDTAVPADTPAVEEVTIEQRGEFKLTPEGDWLPMTATQTVRTDPPGFVWDATIDLRPGLGVRVVDAYVGGEGSLDARLFGAVPVASAGPSAEMNASELQRYLAEAVWYPNALRPGRGVEWTAIDDHAARATIRDGEETASLTFHFDDADLVERVTGDRYRQEDGRTDRWVGRFDEYERRAGRLVPSDGEVGWASADGTQPYWRATMTALDYRTIEGDQ